MVQRRKVDLMSVKSSRWNLTSIELLTLIYIGITTVMMLFMWKGFTNPWEVLALRGIALGIMVVSNIIAWFISRGKRLEVRGESSESSEGSESSESSDGSDGSRVQGFKGSSVKAKIITAIKIIPMLILLIWWYPDIFEFCSQFPYQDHVFAGIDQTLFGCQPALEFDRAVPSPLWSELFCMGYYGYYYMMLAVIMFYLIWRYERLDKAGFIFMGSFFLFYFIYELLPVAGPQFYFRALLDTGEIDSIANSSAFSSLFAEGFPQVGNYFQNHREMISPEIHGIFGKLVIGAQEIGERPEAAFPSSHVGMGTVMMLLAAYSRNKYLFWCMLPIFLLLCCGTVYIKAHYLIDSIAGFFTAIIFFYLTRWIYSQYKG